MSRYIDADALIERWNKMSVRGRTEFDQEIMVAPSIDIVRCGDCKYFIDNLTEDDADEVYGQCCFDWDIKMPQADDFCSYGEREGE